MRIAFIVITSILSLVFLIFILFMKNKKERVRRTLFEAFIAAFLVMVSNVCIALSKNLTFSYIAYAVYFCSIDFLVFFCMLFSFRYTRGKSGIIPYVFLGLCILDTIQMIVNIWTHHCYWVNISVYQTTAYLTYDYTNIYIVHLALNYVMLVLAFVLFIFDMIRSPGLYKNKYYYLLITLTVVTIADGIYLYSNNPINWSVLSFGLIAIGTYYFMLVYAPATLRSDAMKFVSGNMNSGLLILDKDDQLLYMNDAFKKFFSIEKPEDVKELLDFWTSRWKASYIDEFTKDLEDRTEAGKRYYRLNFHRFETPKKSYLGSAFMVTDTTQDVLKLKQEHYYATHDRLTDIYTREYFFHKAEERLKEKPDTEYVIICNDIGNFKFINDMFGTNSADYILKQFGKKLREYCNPDDVYGRLDNDHFAVMIPKERYSEEFFLKVTHEIMESLDHAIGELFICYIGVYEIHEDVFVRSMTDRCMLAIKSIKGSNQRLAYYTEAMSKQILIEQEITGELNEAIENDNIEMYIQPQVNPEGVILGGEALVRWNHPEKGLLPPGLFIPIFEKNGRITDIDKVIWEKAAKQVSEWEKRGLDLYLSVNISPKDLIVLDICKIFTELADKYGINRKHLKLEITETAAMKSVEDTEKLIAKLHKEGFTIEMDDFGSGYSSLNMLKDISVDVVKLDMAFLRETEHKEKATTITECMIRLAQELSMAIVVEGVETKENLDFLVKEGCECFQGYYFARPMPLAEFEKKIAK